MNITRLEAECLADELVAVLTGTPLREEEARTAVLGLLDRHAARVASPDVLSPRQLEIMALVAAGKTDKAIARELGISFTTVKTHVCIAISRLGVHTRAAAVAALRR